MISKDLLTKLSLPLLCFFITVGCEKSNDEILLATIENLENLTTVRYNSILEISQEGKTLVKDTTRIYFDFERTSAGELKYHFENEDGELIYNGNASIQSDNDNRVILINEDPYSLNPLIATLYPLKKILPKMINDPKIKVLRDEDTLLNNRDHYVFDFNISKGYVNWMELDITYEFDYDTNFRLLIDQSTGFPAKIISQNGENGSLSRTIEDLDFEHFQDAEFWTANHLPSDYARYDEKEYYEGFKNTLGSFVGKPIDSWELPKIGDDNIVNPSKLEGKVILLEFWFQNCGYCIKAIPDLNEIQEQYADLPFELYGVEYIANDKSEELSAYMNAKNMKFASLYNGKAVATRYGIRTAPTFMIIDKSGTIAYAESGFDREEIIAKIETLLR